MTSGGPRALPAPAERSVPPKEFTAAVHTLESARIDHDAIIRETPPPTRIAPFSAAVTVDLGDLASGRLVYLHDPAGQQAWSGRDRLVAFARVDVDEDMAADPLLADVVWAWLAEAMESRRAGIKVLGGTVTTTASRRYGNLAHIAPTQEVELRCSWTPTPGADGAADLGPHLAGLVDTLAAMCGMPPTPSGLSSLARNNT